MNSDAVDAVSTFYNERYRQKQYFRYRTWLYRPFVRALVRRAKLKKGAGVLDVGCGQGFFSGLFAEAGLQVVGVDFSAEAVRCASADYGSSGAVFAVGDILSMKRHGCYDCVFARGLSLYNTKDTSTLHDITDKLLEYLKPDGVMIFCFPARCCRGKANRSWSFLSLSDVQQHFSQYSGAQVHFSLRIETLLLGSASFCSPLTLIAAWMSRTTGIGGELIAFVPRAHSALGEKPVFNGHL